MTQEVILDKLTKIENLLEGQKPKPLTFNEAAEYLGLSKSYLYKLTCSRKIPFYKPYGKRVYFEKSELDDWILKNRVKTEAEIEQEADDYIVGKRGSRGNGQS